jgi:hypothetical protein
VAKRRRLLHSHSLPRSSKRQIIPVNESVEFEVEDDVSQSAVAYTQFDTTNRFIFRENPSQILTQLSNVWSESGDEDELIVGGGKGGDRGDGTTFGGDGGDGGNGTTPFCGSGGDRGDVASFDGSALGSSISRNNAMFAQYLQSGEYEESW